MKIATLITRFLMGIPLAAFGAMGLFMIMPDPQAHWEAQEGFTLEARNLLITMWDSGFLMQATAFAHLVVGILLIVNRYVPLALAIHLPVSIFMTLFHLFLDPGTGMIAFLILALNVFLIYRYWDYFKGMLVSKAVLD